MRRVFAAVIASVLLAAGGCGKWDGTGLATAERIEALTAAGRTEKAIAVIDSARSVTTDASERGALTLLHCRAYEAAGLPVSDAEGIAAALDHAAGNALTAGREAELRYYLARAHYNNRNYPAAIFEAAEAASDESADGAIRGGAYKILSLSHSAAHNSTSALTFAGMALELLADDEEANAVYADALTAAGEYEECVEFVGRVSANMPGLARRQLAALTGLGEYEKAAALTEGGEALTADEELQRAYALAALGRLGADDPVLREPQADMSYSREELRMLADIQRMAGNRARSEEIGRRLTAMQDSLIASLAESKIYEDLYGLEHSRRQSEELKARRSETRFMVAVGAAIVAVLAAGVVIMILRMRSAKRRTEWENRLLVLNEELKQRREEGSRKDDALSEMSRRVDVLFKDHYESIEMAANLLLDASLSKNSEKKIADSLNGIIAGCREPKFLRTLEQTVNKYRNNAIARLREQIPEIGEGEMTIILYAAGNLTPRVMCMLTDLSAPALYNKKYRLKKKIAASGARDAKEFADMI